jgi:hypothetical protein
MSHFIKSQTGFNNIKYLEQSLNNLKINYQHISFGLSAVTETVIVVDKGIQFYWTGEEYELIIEKPISVEFNLSDSNKPTKNEIKQFNMKTENIWESDLPNNQDVNYLVEKIAQSYINEVIFGETHKSGFLPIGYQNNIDGSNTIVFERWKR